MEFEDLFEELIEQVVEQIDKDISDKYTRDVEALEELLRFCPVKNLIAYLPEEKHKKYKELLKHS